jgi:hypothetical protein
MQPTAPVSACCGYQVTPPNNKKNKILKYQQGIRIENARMTSVPTTAQQYPYLAGCLPPTKKRRVQTLKVFFLHITTWKEPNSNEMWSTVTLNHHLDYYVVHHHHNHNHHNCFPNWLWKSHYIFYVRIYATFSQYFSSNSSTWLQQPHKYSWSKPLKQFLKVFPY